MIGKLWGYLAVAAAAVAGILALMFTERKKGAATERAKQQEKVIENVTKAEKVRTARRADPGKRDRVRRFDRTAK